MSSWLLGTWSGWRHWELPLWDLQLAVTQGLLSASVANVAPDALRGTAFGIYQLAVGLRRSLQAPGPERSG
jgi:hypothetical protein